MAAVSKMRRAPIRPPRYTMNGPINIKPTSKAVPIHALSSYPNPWTPLKSAKPREIMRLVSVTTPAPVTTPRIPSSGLVETSAGIAAAAARAISIGDGRTAMLEAAICSSSPSRAHSCNHRNSGTQLRREVRLHPFCESNERDHLRAGRDKLSGPNLSFAHGAVARSIDLGVTNVHRRCRKARLLRAQIGLKLHRLRFEDGFAQPLGFGSEFTATQHGSGLIEIGVTARKLA